MKAFLILALIALAALFMTAQAQTPQLPITAKNFRVTAYKNGAPGITSTSNYARAIPPATLYVPNAFTPNGDGINETFNAQGQSITSFNMKIFNRWGEMIFETDDLQRGWDGTYKGVMSQQDVYIYKIKARGEIAGLVEQEGTVTLID